MFEKPPQWQKLITGALVEKIRSSKEIYEILTKARKEYVYWDKFKYFPFPKNITPEEAWAFLKLTRSSSEKTPVKSILGDNFTYSLTKNLYQKLNFIDTHGSGLLKSFKDKPSNTQTSKYIISSLTEEAIASSQIEGANTTHKIAKEMILSQRKPRNKSEQMIVNNYLAMQKMEEWKDLDLTEQMLLDLQKILVDQTVDDVSIIGRFRNDKDDIVVHDPITGEIAHVPPKEENMISELKMLIKYANAQENDDEEFIHPVIKATILHFWFAYLHPFADGNGRSSRAIFYWYLLKKNYWLIEYISVSRTIKQSRKAYDNAFLYSENDDNDMTYFLLYITDAFKKSIIQFMEYFEKKMQEAQELKKTTSVLGKFNMRQVVLLKYFLAHGDEYTDVITHQNKHGISRPSAYNDLRFLVQRGFLTETRKGKRLIYMPKISKIKEVFRSV
ncbi:MAG: Fic family protein [Candidatus Parcubacteria bacterium]|nr:Fic family protein [Candidatus Parcubacteria bacterium]